MSGVWQLCFIQEVFPISKQLSTVATAQCIHHVEPLSSAGIFVGKNPSNFNMLQEIEEGQFLIKKLTLNMLK